MKVHLHPGSIDDYKMFLKIKALPRYNIQGREAWFPDEYAGRLGVTPAEQPPDVDYHPIDGLFDYQRDIAAMAIRKRKFAIFADCGLGKTLIFAEFAKHAAASMSPNRCTLIVSPLMVIPQTMAEIDRFYGGTLPLEQVHAAELGEWLQSGHNRIGITNYEAIRPELQQGHLGCLILDESSMLKSHYGKWGTKCIDLGKGLDWKLCGTGTPAPNDRIEYANHAVFMDAFPTVNAFLARYFVNKGQTNERWILKPHALGPFYRSLSAWSIFLVSPATYGWADNADTLPPIHIHIDDVPLTPEQVSLAYQQTGELFANRIGGITNRAALASIAKGWHKGKDVPTNKPDHIRRLVESWPTESTLIWCLYNAEQERIHKAIPWADSMDGRTPHDVRQRMIDDFKAGRQRVLISKPKILGFGLNLQRATRQIFSGLQDSYESFYQAVKRSNRVGSTRPLNVHIPVTSIEEPMIETVLRKAKMVQADTEEQERIFKQERIT